MGGPGYKIWSNLQLLSLLWGKYLRCDDCYDYNDGIRPGRWAGAVTSSKHHRQENVEREKMGNKRKHLVRICHPNNKNCAYFLANVFTQIISCFPQYFQLASRENMDIWRNGDTMMSPGDVTRGQYFQWNWMWL